MTTSATATSTPIGYWLKHLHNLIEAHFEAALAESGTTRRDWQLLNLLSQGPRTRAEAEKALAPFWRGDPAGLGGVIDGSGGLIARGWVNGDRATGALVLTGKGRAAHAGLAARVGELRELILRDLTLDQYNETVRILSVMAASIEAALAGRSSASSSR
jgi:hypothetical protein